MELSSLNCLKNIFLPDNRRYIFLDSSRGIAAFVVLLAHTIKTFAPIKYDLFPLNILWDSEAAVLYFFILSGFVLNESLDKKKLSLSTYSKFILRRVLRIYPAFIVILTLAFLGYRLIYFPSNNWLSMFWQTIPSFLDLLKQCILIIRLPNDATLRILPHDWTLSIEIMISLFLPFMVAIRKINTFLLLAIVFICVKLLPIETFFFDFALGAVISTEKKKLISFYEKILLWKKIFFVLLAITLLLIDKISAETNSILTTVFIHPKSIGLGILLVLLLSNQYLQKILSNEFLHFQGRISYSVYLIHFVIIGIVYHFFPLIDFLPAFILIYSSTILFSYISYEFIEKRCIALFRS